MINKGHEYEHARSRVRPLGSGSPRACRGARRQGAGGNGRARGPPGRARRPTVALRRRRLRFALRLLHAGAPPLRGRHLQPYIRGSNLPEFSRDPRPPGLGRDVPDLRPAAAPAPHAREPRGRPRQSLWPQPAPDRGPGRGVGAATGCPRFGPEAPHGYARAHVARGTRRDRYGRALPPGAAHQRSAAARGHPSPDHRDHVAGALSRPVHDRQGQPRQASARPGPPAPRDPGRRSGRHLRPRALPAPREGRESEGGAVAKPRAPRPIRPGTDWQVRTPIVPSRDVPRQVQRAAWRRDGGQCGFIAPDGHRCTERTFLELHHVRPYALGGLATVENISLRCRRHNQYEAELVFGPRGTAGRDPVSNEWRDNRP